MARIVFSNPSNCKQRFLWFLCQMNNGWTMMDCHGSEEDKLSKQWITNRMNTYRLMLPNHALPNIGTLWQYNSKQYTTTETHVANPSLRSQMNSSNRSSRSFKSIDVNAGLSSFPPSNNPLYSSDSMTCFKPLNERSFRVILETICLAQADSCGSSIP